MRYVQHSFEQVRALGGLVLGFGEREREMCRLGSGRAAEYMALRRVERMMAKSALSVIKVGVLVKRSMV